MYASSKSYLPARDYLELFWFDQGSYSVPFLSKTLIWGEEKYWGKVLRNKMNYEYGELSILEPFTSIVFIRNAWIATDKRCNLTLWALIKPK